MKKDIRQNNGIKTKGYYQSVYEKCLSAAKEHNASGDHVMAEYHLQHAEHYARFINERFPQWNNAAAEDGNQSVLNEDKASAAAPKKPRYYKKAKERSNP